MITETDVATTGPNARSTTALEFRAQTTINSRERTEYWAACNLDADDLCDEFLKHLSEDEELAMLNRGYLMYYHGDLSRERPPPYKDDHAALSWHNTRQRTYEMIVAPDYSDNSACRQAIDLATFANMAMYHRLSEDEFDYTAIASRAKALLAKESGRMWVGRLAESLAGLDIAKLS